MHLHQYQYAPIVVALSDYKYIVYFFEHILGLFFKEMTADGEIKMEVDPVAVKKLSEGLVQIYEPKLKSVKSKLTELTKKQEVLCDELHLENLKFSEALSSVELQEMFVKIKVYREKLANIKKTMLMLHEQSARLKKRALKLEQQKQKEALQKVQQREHEERLIAKPSSSSLSSIS